ncbi:MAG: hypothetical protein NC311_11510 [Muribaculaceae bacterium]|nr:hypothetical protein [Muribaculaceae bacterium]
MEKNKVADFKVSIPKEAKSLANFVGKDALRPITMYVAIIPDKGILTATDTHILQIYKAECEGEWPETDTRYTVLAEPKSFAKFAGKEVRVTVSEYKKMTEEKDRLNRKVMVEHTFVTVDFNGVTVYDGESKGRFPDVMRIIPDKSKCVPIELGTEGVDSLKKICKLAGNRNDYDYIALSTKKGSDLLTIARKHDDSDPNMSFALRLKHAAGSDFTVGFDTNLLKKTLEQCDGHLYVHDVNHPVLIGNASFATVIMPKLVEGHSLEAVEQARNEQWEWHTGSLTEDIKKVALKLQEQASELWGEVLAMHTVDGKCCLTPGNYAARDIEVNNKAKCGYYQTPCNWYEKIEIRHGRIKLSLTWGKLFGILPVWESFVKEKAVFKVGDVTEVTREVLINKGEDVVTEKRKLRVLGKGWLTDVKRNKHDFRTAVYYKLNNCIFRVDFVDNTIIDDLKKFEKWSVGKNERVRDLLLEKAKTDNGWKKIAEMTGLLKPEEGQTPAGSFFFLFN